MNLSIIITKARCLFTVQVWIMVLCLPFVQGCTTSPQVDQPNLNENRDDRVLGGRDTIASSYQDTPLGGKDQFFTASDLIPSGGDEVLNYNNDRVLNAGHDQIIGQTDLVLNSTPSVQRPKFIPTPKRPLTNKEMAALTVAVSVLSDDPNSLSVVSAKVDDTDEGLRNLCAQLRDIRLDDDNNRFNTVFAILEARSTEQPLISIIDSGQRAFVVCNALGYFS